jgi:hypothetical protein
LTQTDLFGAPSVDRLRTVEEGNPVVTSGGPRVYGLSMQPNDATSMPAGSAA